MINKSNARQFTRLTDAPTSYTGKASRPVVVKADESGLEYPTAPVNFDNQKLVNVGNPTNPQDVATKYYADLIAAGLSLRQSCRLATTANLTATYSGGVLTETGFGALSIDGVTPSVGDRILVKNQTTAKDNGIYTVTTVGNGGASYVLTRATDNDSSAEMVAGLFTFITAGTTNAAHGFALVTPDPITLDTTDLTFSELSSATNYIAGTGLNLSGLTFSVDFSLVQALDATLTALAAYNTNGFVVQIAHDTFVGREIIGGAGVSVINGDGGVGDVSITADINGLVEEGSPDVSVDEVMIYNDATGQNKKATLSTIARLSSEIYRQVGTSPIECWYSSGIDCSTQITFTTAVAATTHTMYAVPFLAGKGGALDSIAIYVQTGVANTVGRVGLYSSTSDTNLYPDELIVDSLQFDTSTAGKKSATISATLESGKLYWLVFSFDNTSGTLSGAQIKGLPVTSIPNILGVGSSLNTTPYSMLSLSGQTYGVLPAIFGAGATLTTGSVPMAWLRFSA